MDKKLASGDIQGAVRLLCSEESIAPNDENTFSILKEKHPTSLDEITIDDQQVETNNFEISESEVKFLISSFKPGSAGGIDSLKPQHLKDLSIEKLGATSTLFLKTLCKLVKKILEESLLEEIRPVFATNTYSYIHCVNYQLSLEV